MIYFVTNNLELHDRPKNSGIKLCSPEESVSALKKLTTISADTETTGLIEHGNKLLLLQLGNYEDQYVIDVQSVNIKIYAEILQDPSKLFIWHNAQFDLKFLFKHKLYTPKVFDTMLAEHIINRGGFVSASLKNIAFKYTNAILDKSVRSNFHKQTITDREIRYAAEDIKYLEKIKDAQVKQLKDLQLVQYALLEFQFVISLAYVAHCGIFLHHDKWLEKSKEDEQNLNLSIKALNDYMVKHHSDTPFISHQMSLFDDAGEPQTSQNPNCVVTWSSPKEVIKVFETVLNLDLTVFNKGKKSKSVEQKHIQKYADEHPLIKLYLHYTKLSKLVSTYGRKFLENINKSSNRVHTTFKQILATGRISSGESGENSPFPNLQNLPRDSRHRHCFGPQKKSDTMIIGDFSQQEQIILANFSKEPNLVKFFKEGGGDMHSYNTQKIFKHLKDTPLHIIKSNYPEERYLAKTVGFAINYGGGAYTITKNANIPLEKSNEIFENYFKAFPDLSKYYERVKREAFRNQYILVNPYTGSKTFFPVESQKLEPLEKEIKHPDFWDQYKYHKSHDTKEFKEHYKSLVKNYFGIKGSIERMAMNYPIQGTAAEMTKLAVIKIFNYLVTNDLLYKVKICILVHDEIVLEVPKDIQNEMSQVLKDCMESAANTFCKILPVKAEPVISEVWTH